MDTSFVHITTLHICEEQTIKLINIGDNIKTSNQLKTNHADVKRFQVMIEINSCIKVK